MSKDDCCGGGKKVTKDAPVRAHTAMAEHKCVPEGLLNQSTKRALEIICELREAIHMDTKPGIGHIHYLFDAEETARLQQLRTEFLTILPRISPNEKTEHIASALQASCGSVAEFIQAGKLPHSKFDIFYHRLMGLDSHFHEHGEGHVHRKPPREELEHVGKLRAECLSLIGKLREDQAQNPRLAAALNLCCGTTLEFIKTGQIA